MIGRAAHVEPLHSRLVLQAVVSVLINQLLNSFQIAFNNRGDVHDISHDAGLFQLALGDWRWQFNAAQKATAVGLRYAPPS
jgi:hypothetical protein